MQRWSEKFTEKTSFGNKYTVTINGSVHLYSYMRLGRNMPTFETISHSLVFKSSFYLNIDENEYWLWTFPRTFWTSGKVDSEKEERTVRLSGTE